jgi:hypothetical protein
LDPLSFGRLWPETVAAVRRHTDLLWPVAAAFLFFPQLLFAWQAGDRTPDMLFQGDKVLGDGLAVLLLILAGLVGQLVMAMVIARNGTGGETLGALLKRAFALLLPALAVSLIQGIGVGFGFVLLVIPGLWLLARLALVLPLVATDHPDPIEALRASWALSKGRALRILGVLSVLLLGFLLLSIGITGLGAAVGVISTIATGGPDTGWSVGRWLFEAIGAAASAAMGTFYIAFLTILTGVLKQTPPPSN